MKSQHLAFVSSAIEYTQRFFPVAQHMEKKGMKVYWISHRKAEYLWLRERGVPDDKILNTAAYKEASTNETILTNRLAELETKDGPLIHNVIGMDRMLRRHPTAFAYQYLGYLDGQLREFLTKNDIAYVTGGNDSSLQLLCYLVCNKLKRKWILAMGCRLPKERFGLVDDHVCSDFLPLTEPGPEAYAFAEKFLEEFLQGQAKPIFYAYPNRLLGILKLAPKHFRLFMMNFYTSLVEGGSVVSWYTNTQLVKMYFRRRLNMVMTRFFSPFEQPRETRPYVLYALQAQPESSIDVFASYFSDQLSVIRQISRALPVTHDLYVKGHPGDLGGQPLSFFREIKRVPGVRLIDPQVPSKGLMQKASLVVSPAGTICLESGLLGKPTILFTNLFFSQLPTVHVCDSPVRLVTMVKELVDSPPPADYKEKAKAYLAKIYARTVVGQYDGFFAGFSEADKDAMASVYKRAFDFC